MLDHFYLKKHLKIILINQILIVLVKKEVLVII